MRDRHRATVRGRTPQLAALLSLGVLALSPLVLTWQAACGQTPDIQGQLQAPVVFNLDPKTPLKHLLPIPPRVSRQAKPLLAADLTRVPEVHFQESLTFPELPAHYDRLADKEKIEVQLEILTQQEELQEATAHQIAKINFLNAKKVDHFMELLLAQRPDLAGLPFVMGADCRRNEEASQRFTEAVVETRGGLNPVDGRVLKYEVGFWAGYANKYPPTKAARSERKTEHQAVLAALMQMLPVEGAELRAGLAPYLAARPDKEATRALAQLAIFDADAAVRKASLHALERRAPTDVKDTLLRGLNYPWPEVAKNAADALAHLKRTDLVSHLIDLLDQPDPRAPEVRIVKGKKVPVVRELVRINHHRNCLLCHAPGNTPDVTPKVLTGTVPILGKSLSQGGYGASASDVVRIDVTYLRQDFSRLQQVADAAPWPSMQRFDFLVRTRVLTETEAGAYRAEFARLKTASPYRLAALTALRSLTGRDAAPTAQAWRQLLGLPGAPAAP